jgi:pimeloyl-ACP methyl ester carboxylesterase
MTETMRIPARVRGLLSKRPVEELRKLAIGFGAVYLVVLVLLFGGQRRILYPRSAPLPLPDVPGSERLDVPITGGSVPVLWMDGPGTVPIIWFHGNGEQLAWTGKLVKALVARGFDVAAVEYPGYGLATGPGPSESAIVEAADGAMDLLAKRGITRPVCGGHSLGTGVAAHLAVQDRCRALVLVSPYTSLPAAGAFHYWFVPVRWMMFDRFDTLGSAAKIRVPTFVTHGREDTVIPFEEGEAVAAAIPGATFLPRKGSHMILDAQTWDAIARFVATLPEG